MEQARALLKKYQSGRCSHEERLLVESWYYRRLKQALPSDEQVNLREAKWESRKRILGKIAFKPVNHCNLPAGYIWLYLSGR